MSGFSTNKTCGWKYANFCVSYSLLSSMRTTIHCSISHTSLFCSLASCRPQLHWLQYRTTAQINFNILQQNSSSQGFLGTFAIWDTFTEHFRLPRHCSTLTWVIKLILILLRTTYSYAWCSVNRCMIFPLISLNSDSFWNVYIIFCRGNFSSCCVNCQWYCRDVAGGRIILNFTCNGNWNKLQIAYCLKKQYQTTKACSRSVTLPQHYKLYLISHQTELFHRSEDDNDHCNSSQ